MSSMDPEVDVRVSADTAAEYLGVSTGVIYKMFEDGIFLSITYKAGGTHKPLLSEVRTFTEHPRIVKAHQRRQARKDGRTRATSAATERKQVAQRLADVQALLQEHHRILTQMGVTVTYHDLDNPPEDAVGENQARPGQPCPGYKGAPSCGGKLRLRWSGQPDDRKVALHGWFIGCTGWKHDHSGCEFCETIVRSKTSAIAPVIPLPVVVPVPTEPSMSVDGVPLPEKPPDSSGNSGSPLAG